MKESTLRKLILVLLAASIISLLWAVGSNSRKKVELEKSKTLETKLDKIVVANTALVSDLKSAHNRLAKLQQAERTIRKKLEEEVDKKKQIQEKMESATNSALGNIQNIDDLIKEVEILKNTNMALGEELLSLKEKEAQLRLELDALRSRYKTKNNNKSTEYQSTKPQEKTASNKSFNWK